MRSAFLLAVVFCATTARAQSTIYGLDVRLDMFFTSDTGSFVASHTTLGMNPDPVFAIDFDAAATTLWGIKNDTLEYGTFDLNTGLFTPIGTISGPTGAPTGLTAAVNGSWFVSEYVAVQGRSFLWVGDVTTGGFTLVGFIAAGIIIDISIDTQGNLYGNNISDDSLYRIDTSTGTGTLLGPTGQATNFAQGMDFDWSTNTLYATLYTGMGTGVFATMNLTTGAATVLEDTTPLNGEFEMAIQVAAGAIGSAYCFGDGSGTACPCGNNGNAGEGCANSTGSGAVLAAGGSNSASADDLVFTSGNLIPGQPALLFSGLNAINGGNGIPFGDGLRCAGAGVVRLGVRIPNAQGDATWGPGLGATGGWTSGDLRRVQSWYRNPAGSPCGFNFNLSHGFEITFTP